MQITFAQHIGPDMVDGKVVNRTCEDILEIIAKKIALIEQMPESEIKHITLTADIILNISDQLKESRDILGNK